MRRGFIAVGGSFYRLSCSSSSSSSSWVGGSGSEQFFSCDDGRADYLPLFLPSNSRKSVDVVLAINRQIRYRKEHKKREAPSSVLSQSGVRLGLLLLFFFAATILPLLPPSSE